MFGQSLEQGGNVSGAWLSAEKNIQRRRQAILEEAGTTDGELVSRHAVDCQVTERIRK